MNPFQPILDNFINSSGLGLFFFEYHQGTPQHKRFRKIAFWSPMALEVAKPALEMGKRGLFLARKIGSSRPIELNGRCS